MPKSATKLPFINARFDFDEDARDLVEERLTEFLDQLRSRMATTGAPETRETSERDDIFGRSDFGRSDAEKIGSRVRRLMELRKEKSGLSHLKHDQLRALLPLKDGVSLVQIPSVDRADKIAAELHEEFPWMGAATERVWHEMRRSVLSGSQGLRLPPMLIDGPPGIGKSAWARHLAKLIGSPEVTIDATNQSASFGVIGVQRGWGSASPGKLIKHILRHLIANPIVIIDEIEKSGVNMSTSGHSHDLPTALLPLFEPMTACKWTCPFYEVQFDMSWVCWIMTSNDARTLPSPLLSRCPPIRIPDLTPDQLVGFIRRVCRQRGLSEASAEAVILTVLRCLAMEKRIDLRTVSRMIDRAEGLEQRPLLN